MREPGLIEKDLNLPPRARDRFPVFLKASWRLLVANPWLLLLAAIWPGFVVIDRWASRDTVAIPDFARVSPRLEGWDMVIGSVVRDGLAAVITCAALAILFAVLRGDGLNVDRGITVVIANLRLLGLVTLVSVVFDLATQWLYFGITSDLADLVGIVGTFILTFVLFYVFPVIADTGARAGEVIVDSWLLLRLTRRDVGFALFGFLVPVGFLATVPVFVLQAWLDIEGDPFASAGGEILYAFAWAPISAFFVAYTVRLYLFARSVEAAEERREDAAG